ncbi:MAG TPA: hypothetical protein VIM58_06370 [Candidatus Methylacidiphilales bacterium]
MSTKKGKKKPRPRTVPPENVYPVRPVPPHVLPVMLALGAVLAGIGFFVFPAPPGPGQLFEKVRFAAFFAAGLACAWVAFSTKQLGVEVVGRELHVKGDLFRKKIDAASIRIERARVVNLASDPDCGLSWLLFGVPFLPGYTTGLFVLRRGGSAWALVTDRREVLWLPTTEGYTLLLSVERGAELLERLRKFDAKLKADVAAKE